METIRTIYLSELRTKAEHVRSGSTLITDAPVDNQGKGENFSPTDLVVTALGSCALTIMGIAANTHQFSINGTHLKITKIMATDPRRIGEIIIDFDFPKLDFTDKQKKILEHAAYTCPVGQSLHPGLKQTFNFNFS
jgi:putative redox protein